MRNRKRSGQNKLKAFAAKLYREWGMDKKAKEVMEMKDIPVLRPRRGMKYPFVS